MAFSRKGLAPRNFFSSSSNEKRSTRKKYSNKNSLEQTSTIDGAAASNSRTADIHYKPGDDLFSLESVCNKVTEISDDSLSISDADDELSNKENTSPNSRSDVSMYSLASTPNSTPGFSTSTSRRSDHTPRTHHQQAFGNGSVVSMLQHQQDLLRQIIDQQNAFKTEQKEIVSKIQDRLTAVETKLDDKMSNSSSQERQTKSLARDLTVRQYPLLML